MFITIPRTAVAAATAIILAGTLSLTQAHCDTYDGPVVKAAQRALETGKADFALIWVAKSDEPEIRKVFQETQAVRKLGPQAKRLADNYFFETLVRIHRAGEGAPYTGLKPAGKVDPAISLADKALETGSGMELTREMTEHFQKALKEKFDSALEGKKHAGQSVEAGRAYVHAYVKYVHFVEGVHSAITGAADRKEALEPVLEHQH